MIEHVKRFQMPILIGIGAVVALAVLYVGMVAPQGKKLSHLHGQESQLQQQQTHLQAEIAQFKADKAQMTRNCALLGKALTEIPSAPDVSAFLQQVTTLAVQTGNPNTPAISVLQAPSASGAGGATPVQVSLTLNGTYGQMAAFIKGLDSFPRLFTVSNINVSGGPIASGGTPVNPATAGYSLNLTGEIFYSLGRVDACSKTPTASA